jgi:Glycosyl transferases group 1
VELVRSFHFGCLLSHAEALGISTLECLRLGVPVIATALGGIVDTVPKRAGLLIPAERTSERLAEELAAVLETPERYARMRAAAAEVAAHQSRDAPRASSSRCSNRTAPRPSVAPLEDDPSRCLGRTARPDQRPHLSEIHRCLGQRLGLPEREAQSEELRSTPATDPSLLGKNKSPLLGILAHGLRVSAWLHSDARRRSGRPYPMERASSHGTEGSPWGRSQSGRSGGRATTPTVSLARTRSTPAGRAVGHAPLGRSVTSLRPRRRLSPGPPLSRAASEEASR